MPVEKMCRVCLSESEELTPLRVRPPGANKTLEETINFVVNTNILVEDGLPDKICERCLPLLDVANSFKQRFLESEALLSQVHKDKCTNDSLPLLKKSGHEYSEISTEDTSCLRKDSLQEEIKNVESNYGHMEYKIKIEIDENCYGQESVSSEQDVKITLSELKEEPLTDDESPVDINNEITRNPANVLKHSDMETDFGNTCNQEQPTCIVNTAVKTEGDVLTCDICKYTTRELENFNAHLKTHSTTKKFACNHCSYSTIRSDRLKNHIIMKHTKDQPDQDKPFSCNICQKKYKRNDYLNEHLKTHADSKLYPCTVCNKKFTRKIRLDYHIKTHTGVRPYSCDTCKKEFTAKPALMEHLTIHTGEKPYACSICQKEFRLKQVLNRHLKTHTDDKPYSCSICQMKFRRNQHLKNHLSTHTDVKYPCNVCNKRYRHKQGLEIHKRIHSSGKPYSCNYCEKEYVNRPGFIKHVQSHTVAVDKP